METSTAPSSGESVGTVQANAPKSMTLQSMEITVSLPPYEVLDVEGDYQCGLRALYMSAGFRGLSNDVGRALITLGWTNVPRNLQWTDDALGAIAIQAGFCLVIYSHNADTVVSYGPVNFTKTIFLYYSGIDLRGHYQAMRLKVTGPWCKFQTFRTFHTFSVDAATTMQKMVRLSLDLDYSSKDTTDLLPSIIIETHESVSSGMATVHQQESSKTSVDLIEPQPSTSSQSGLPDIESTSFDLQSTTCNDSSNVIGSHAPIFPTRVESVSVSQVTTTTKTTTVRGRRRCRPSRAKRQKIKMLCESLNKFRMPPYLEPSLWGPESFPEGMLFSNVDASVHNDNQPINHGVFFSNLRPIQTDWFDPPKGGCFNCWNFGHNVNNCTIPQQRIFCKNCGRTNVWIDLCPRCRDEYAAFLQRNAKRV